MNEKLEIFFWQNIVSPHQAAFLKNLSKIENISVTLFAEQNISDERKNMGWENPDLGTVNVCISPSDDIINEVFKNTTTYTVHVFSGLRAYPMVWNAFNKMKNTAGLICMMAEPPDWVGWKGKLRLLRNKIDCLLFRSNIDIILGIGPHAKKWFVKSGYNVSNIFDWGYFVDVNPDENVYKTESGTFNIKYIGRLIKAKGADKLLMSLSNCIGNFHLTIIGDGPEKRNLTEIVNSDINLKNKVSFKNFLPQAVIKNEIQTADLLVLPSTGKDGWGVVVNEALHLGTPLIVSSNCGASILLKNPILGNTFDPNKNNDLTDLIEARIKKGPISFEEKKIIRTWADNHIDSSLAAKYFLEIIYYKLHSLKIKPEAPWQKYDFN